MDEQYSSQPFNFDSWASLARSNPQAFENKRRSVIEQAIGQAPDRCRPRLRCLQWKLDQLRRTAPNPLAATIRMQELMWEKVTGEDGLQARLQMLRRPAIASKKAVSGAKILQFRQKAVSWE